MKRLTLLIVLTLGVSCLCADAQITAQRITSRVRGNRNAQTESAPDPSNPNGQDTNAVPAVPKVIISPIVVALDTNKNGILDAAEIANAPVALKKLDLNGDGKLTPDEYLAKGETTPSTLLVKVLDLNGDGVIDEREIASSPSNLRLLDKNFDNRVSPGEFRMPAPPAPKPVAGASGAP